MIRPSVLWLAALMASPALYLAFVAEEMSVQSALARFLIAVPAAALMLAALRFITAGYGTSRARELPLRRRRTDQPVDEA